MKAIVGTAYGPLDVLQRKKVAKPTPKHNEVRIKIFATVVTASDCIVRGFKLPIWRPMGQLMMGRAAGEFGRSTALVYTHTSSRYNRRWLASSG